MKSTATTSTMACMSEPSRWTNLNISHAHVCCVLDLVRSTFKNIHILTFRIWNWPNGFENSDIDGQETVLWHKFWWVVLFGLNGDRLPWPVPLLAPKQKHSLDISLSETHDRNEKKKREHFDDVRLLLGYTQTYTYRLVRFVQFRSGCLALRIQNAQRAPTSTGVKRNTIWAYFKWIWLQPSCTVAQHARITWMAHSIICY